MKVYILTYGYVARDGEEIDEYLGAYSTREKAEFARGNLLKTRIREEEVK